jgi:hypothetical protein
MKPKGKSDILASVEAKNRELLYKARWDAKTAAKIVPSLIELLNVGDEPTLYRTLSALMCIGPEAETAAPAIAPLLHSANVHVCDNAALTLARVSLRNPKLAVAPLMTMACNRDRLKYAMFGLIELGPAAKQAASIFAQAYGDKDARIRRLALRGLKECDADAAIAVPILNKAKTDRSKEIRIYAGKILDRYSRSKS